MPYTFFIIHYSSFVFSQDGLKAHKPLAGCRFACPVLGAFGLCLCIIGYTSTIQASLIVFGLHDNSARALAAAKPCRKNMDFEHPNYFAKQASRSVSIASRSIF